ncbi:MAG: sugar ABC transporter permease [Eubacteriales bacterium]
MQQKRGKGFSFIILPIILISLFSFYPMITAFFTSLQSGMGMNLEYVGFKNYSRLLNDPMFHSALKNTLTYLVIQVPFMIISSLAIAAILNNKRIKFRGFFRTAIFLPCVTSLVACSIIFKSLFATSGLVNEALLALSIIDSPIMWITDAFWAKVTIIITITWRWTGYNMIFYLAGLQNIDPCVYEAAEIDGANAFTRFFKITVPLLKSIILFTTIMSTNGTLQLFDEVMNITGGGPGVATLTISQYIYYLCFKYTPDFGYASAVSYVILILVSILAFIQLKIGGDKNA